MHRVNVALGRAIQLSLTPSALLSSIAPGGRDDRLAFKACGEMQYLLSDASELTRCRGLT
jgi:hypothetical protein